MSRTPGFPLMHTDPSINNDFTTVQHLAGATAEVVIPHGGRQRKKCFHFEILSHSSFSIHSQCHLRTVETSPHNHPASAEPKVASVKWGVCSWTMRYVVVRYSFTTTTTATLRSSPNQPALQRRRGCFSLALWRRVVSLIVFQFR